MQHRFLNIDGIRTEVLESEGTGDPIFVFHGNSGAANSFQTLLDSRLGQRHRVIAVSFMGHGESATADDPAESYTIKALGDFAAQVVASYGCARYWLVGQSLGGHALIESIDSFKGALGLILVSAPPISLSTLFQAFRPDPSHGCLFKGDLADEEIDLLVSCFTEQASAQMRTTLTDNIRRTDARFRPALGGSLAQGALLDEVQLLEASPIPVAMLGGALDKFVNPDYYRSLPAQRLWKAQPIIFDGCGHMLHMEAPEAFERVVAEFVA